MRLTSGRVLSPPLDSQRLVAHDRFPVDPVDSIPARVTRCSASQSPSFVIPAVVVAKVCVY